MNELSVLMSVYFKEKSEYLDECLQSLTCQTLPAVEVVLVEDGEISLELHTVIDSYRDQLNIISVPLVKNVGLACALNEGLKNCSYDLVARMDTDDVAVTNRFEKQVAFMQANPEIAASSGFIEEFNDSGEILSQRALPLTHDGLVGFAKKRSPLSHPAVIFRKDAVLAVGGYPELYPEDYLMWVKLIQAGYKIANVPDVLVKMRTGDDFIIRRGWKFLKGQLKVYHYMYKTDFINFLEFINIVISISVLRLSPGFIKKFLYKVAR
jgi:glycosyltransferase involved in cell wall biosynthesis